MRLEQIINEKIIDAAGMAHAESMAAQFCRRTDFRPGDDRLYQPVDAAGQVNQIAALEVSRDHQWRGDVGELNFIFEQRFGNPAAATNEQHLSIQSFVSENASLFCAPDRHAAATERGVSNP